MNNKKSWYAIYTKPRAEKQLNLRLIENGIETFFPLVKTLRQWSDRKKIVEVPLFPSYIFIKIDLVKEYEKIRRIYGVVNFVYYIGKPAKIRETEIKAIEEFLGKTEHKSIEFVSGEEVQVISGLLIGKKGKIIRLAKNKVLLQIEELGTIIKAELAKTVLAKA